MARAMWMMGGWEAGDVGAAEAAAVGVGMMDWMIWMVGATDGSNGTVEDMAGGGRGAFDVERTMDDLPV